METCRPFISFLFLGPSVYTTKHEEARCPHEHLQRPALAEEA